MTKIVDFFKKISKAPTIVFGLVIVATYFFANAFSIIQGSNEYLRLVNEQLRELGFNYESALPSLRIVYCILEPLVGWGIFEIIISIIYRSLYLRGQINSNSKFFKQTARAIYCVANFVVGLYSISYFWSPVMQVLGTSILNFIVYTLAFTFMHSIYTWSVIKPTAIYDSFMKLFTFYFILLGALAVINMITAILNVKEIGTLTMVMMCVRVAVIIAIACGVYFLYGKKLRKRVINYVAESAANYEIHHGGDERADFDKIFGGAKEPPKDDKDKPNDEIFKGFGF